MFSPSAIRKGRASVLAKGRLKAGVMNGLEKEYDSFLARRMMAGEVLWYRFESVTLVLADRVRYTPDFAVMLSDGMIEMHEVKGYWRDDAKVKIKMAADKFPFRFVSIQKKRGNWEFEEF